MRASELKKIVAKPFVFGEQVEICLLHGECFFPALQLLPVEWLKTKEFSCIAFAYCIFFVENEAVRDIHKGNNPDAWRLKRKEDWEKVIFEELKQEIPMSLHQCNRILDLQV